MTQEMFDLDQLTAIPSTPLPTRDVSDPEVVAVGTFRQVVCATDPLNLERIAKAIWDADRLNGGMDSWRSTTEGHREDYRNMARGAILALEEETKP